MNCPCKCIWKGSYYGCMIFMVVTIEACLTHENSRTKGCRLCSRCVLCSKALESNGHLFILSFHYAIVAHVPYRWGADGLYLLIPQ